ncbi:hypothetical protein BDZ94DRAFT_1166796 [Collybia nuda]|uniref:MARVEL domain-containing protein n=1 Tax=Collybia nuda TaxID=64659 RepID=A0A9P5Y638_9AGAR|nr:hypothetical protein BDZ94DRAFT_1166796 [Collybia nuda]
MTFDTHVRRGHPIIFGLLIIFGIIQLSLSAWLTSRYNANHNYRNTTERDRVRYVLFCSIWTVVFSFFYLFMFMVNPTGSVLTSVASHLLFLGISWIFWVAAAAAVTEMLGGGLNCSNQSIFVYCGQLNALEAFCWIIWIIITIALIVVIIRGVSAARRGDGYRGGLVAA